MKHRLIVLILAGMVGLPHFANAQSMKPTGRENYRPAEGYVPNASVAEQIAYAVLVPIYGREQIDLQRPFRVMLIRQGTIWKIEGSLPRGTLGGVFEVEVDKRNGRIIRMAHYK